MLNSPTKLKLHGFNNLTKSLSFSFYDIKYIEGENCQQRYQDYLQAHYNSQRLTDILTKTCQIIGATPLNIAKQEYQPHGASVTMLVAEQAPSNSIIDNSPADTLLPQALVGHLDKSHICIHTYPESHSVNNIHTFRADIEVSSCGVITPLKALSFLIKSVNAQVLVMDYRVRGFTRDFAGKKHYRDHELLSIQNFLNKETLTNFHMEDHNLSTNNLFHTKLMAKDHGQNALIKGEMLDIFNSQ